MIRPALVALALSMAGPAAERHAAGTETLYLSGKGSDDAVEWDFLCSRGRNCGSWTRIRVPSCWEQQGFGSYAYGRPPRPAGASASAAGDEEGRYRTTFTPPASWSDRRVRLVFEGVMTDTEAWINGVPAGPVHQGGFYRFSYDVTRLLTPGSANTLEVTVRKTSANESVNRAERRGDYWNFGGIFRPVYLEALPPAFIDRIAIDARADGRFEATAFLGGDAGATRRVEAEIVDAQERRVGVAFAADVEAGGDRATLRTRLASARSWTAETPRLYRVRLTLFAGGRASHTASERFGFRSVELRAGDGVYVNGRKVVFKGANRHSFSPDTGRTLNRRISEDDVRLMKQMNMNAVRMSHYPPDAHFLDACDELGLYVIDELAGWQGAYDTPTGVRLAAQTVQRDVNHPSVLFWANGNEGGWNPEVDPEFARWDPQRRPVLHPWASFGAIDTAHYRTHAEIVRLAAGPDLFMPTELLHGLYDGGGGAGLWDYWETMRKSRFSAGLFLWALLDECVARTDEGGRLDCAGNAAPDGVLGPRREKEGSFHTIREIWSPVQVDRSQPAAETLRVENRYDFTNLARCRFDWSLGRFPEPHQGGTGHTLQARGSVPGPAVAPHGVGELRLPLPEDWRQADVLYLTARDPEDRELWTWSWSLNPARPLVARPEAGAGTVSVREDGETLAVASGSLELLFDRASGVLASVKREGRPLRFGNGPRFFAYLRSEREAEPPASPAGQPRLGGLKLGQTRYQDVLGRLPAPRVSFEREADAVVVQASYGDQGSLARWRIAPGARVTLEYAHGFEGEVDLLGMGFDVPETEVRSLRWLGRGPYRVWSNRMLGTRLDVWESRYNATRPGESWAFPEFQGYFGEWSWAVLETTDARVTLVNRTTPGADGAGASFLGVFAPDDGAIGPLTELPETGFGWLDAIPAIRNKFEAADLLGPQSAPSRVRAPRRGVVELRFDRP